MFLTILKITTLTIDQHRASGELWDSSLSGRAHRVDLVRSSLAESGFLVRDNAQVMRVNEAEMGGQIRRRQMGNK